MQPLRGFRKNNKSAVIAGAAVVALIAFGSLFPFHFYARPDSASVFQHLLATAGRWNRVDDLIADVFLYIPLGLLVVYKSVRPSWSGMLRVTLAGLAISLCIEIAQFHSQGRVSEMADVYANTAGTLVGAGIAVGLRSARIQSKIGFSAAEPLGALMLLCFAAARLYPQAVDSAAWHPLDFYANTVTWLAVAVLLEAVFPSGRGSRIFASLVVVIGLARFAMQGLAVSEIGGAVAAVLLWFPGLRSYNKRATVVAALFTGMVVFQALEPFTFSRPARPFGMIPFLSLINTPVEARTRVALEKTFAYGALLWLMVRSGLSWRFSTAAGAVLILSVRLCQVFLPGRSAEITDAVMFLALAAIFHGEAGTQSSAKVA